MHQNVLFFTVQHRLFEKKPYLNCVKSVPVTKVECEAVEVIPSTCLS